MTKQLQEPPVFNEYGLSKMLAATGFWPIAIYPAGETIKTRGGDKIATGKEPIGREWGLTRRDELWLRSAFRSYPGAWRRNTVFRSGTRSRRRMVRRSGGGRAASRRIARDPPGDGRANHNRVVVDARRSQRFHGRWTSTLDLAGGGRRN